MTDDEIFESFWRKELETLENSGLPPMPLELREILKRVAQGYFRIGLAIGSSAVYTKPTDAIAEIVGPITENVSFGECYDDHNRS